MHKHIFFCLVGVLFLVVSNHGQSVVIEGDSDDESKDKDAPAATIRKVTEDDESDDDDGPAATIREFTDDSNFETVGKPLVRREFFDLNKLFQRRQASSFTESQRKYQQYALEAHNRHRARHCVPALKLDDTISRSAQNYAQYLANINRLVHSGVRGYGENLYMEGSSDVIKSIDGNKATNAWYNEISSYSFNRPGFSMGTGHFTQVVWKDSTKLGVGYAITSDGRSLYVVAQYSPQGNYQGQFGQNVLPAKC